MHPVQIYSFVLGGMLALLLFYQVSSSVLSWAQRRTIFYVFKHLVYPLFLKRHLLLGPTTRWETMLILLYWTGTAICNVIGVKSLPEAGLRAGSISVFHLIPLLLSDRLCFAADLFGLSPQLFRKCHTSLGLMATAQAIIHVAIFLSKNPFQVHRTTHFYGLLVSQTPFHLGLFHANSFLRP